jgi:segregation and condensation protein B
LYATTKGFLDHFNLKSLTDLPTLAEFKNLEAQEANLQVQLVLDNPEGEKAIPDNVVHLAEAMEQREQSSSDDIEVMNE